MGDDRIRMSDDPSGVDHHAGNLPPVFPFSFGWKIDNETLVLTFMNQDRALKALNRLQELRRVTSVKAVEGDPD